MCIRDSLRHVLGYLLGLALPEGHHLVSPALHLLDEEEDEPDHQKDRQDLNYDGKDAGAGLRVDLDLYVFLLAELLHYVEARGEGRFELLLAAEDALDLLVAVEYLDRVHVVLLDLPEEPGELPVSYTHLTLPTIY